MSFTKEQLREQMLLYAVTDRHWLNGQTLYEQVEEALKGGATFIQLLSLIHISEPTRRS